MKSVHSCVSVDDDNNYCYMGPVHKKWLLVTDQRLCRIYWYFVILLLFSTDKFKGKTAELKESKSCIDLKELQELLKVKRTEK